MHGIKKSFGINKIGRFVYIKFPVWFLLATTIILVTIFRWEILNVFVKGAENLISLYTNTLKILGL
jgi:hypothetical protein